MPLLTPLRQRGSTAPMLKEANYSQYLPHSREARSCRGQACETFLQPAAARPPSHLSLPLSLSILPRAASSLFPMSHLASLTFFLTVHLRNIHLFSFACIKPSIIDYCGIGPRYNDLFTLS